MGQTSNYPVPAVGANAAGSAGSAQGTIFASAAVPAGTVTSAPIANPSSRGVRLFINITNANGGTVTARIQNFDPVSQTWVDLAGAVTAALATNALTTLTVYPGVTETANVDVASSLGSMWRVVAVVATATVTFSIGGEYLG